MGHLTLGSNMYKTTINSRTSGNAARYLVHHTNFPFLIFLYSHVPLVLLMQESNLVATLHALATGFIGVLLALSRRPLSQVAYIFAYITGAEVLWRMTEASVFYEYGKYILVLVALLAMLRIRRLGGPLLPLVYFCLLLPSVIMTITQTDIAEARRQLSFNLSGPLSLFVSAWFFSHLRMSRTEILRFLLALIAPTIGIATIALHSTLTAENIRFFSDSNFVTSGGFGPNQVSAILGLGALCSFFYLLNDHRSRVFRTIITATMLVLLSQSILTFSRTGLYVFGISLVFSSLLLFRNPSARTGIITLAALIIFSTSFLILPALNTFTNGVLLQRFTDINPAGREKLIQADLEVWRQNPIVGVGPGGARLYREDKSLVRSSSLDEVPVAHTEFSRLLAEHGMLGLAAVALLAIMGIRNLRKPCCVNSQALRVALLSSCLFLMLVSAMRTVAPAMFFGLCFASFELGEK